jgi:predicted nucleic acid-binding protein
MSKMTIDTSVWINLLNDKSGEVEKALRHTVGQNVVLLLGPVRMELLQGCRDVDQWNTIEKRLAAFQQIDVNYDDPWIAAARIYFDLRQRGITVRSPMDCYIASICEQNNCVLIHDDRDFDAIATLRPLKHLRLSVDKATL